MIFQKLKTSENWVVFRGSINKIATLILVFSFLINFSLDAQDTLSKDIPRFVFKTSPFGWANSVKSFWQIGADIRFAPKWAADFGVGRYFDSRYFAYYAGETYLGLRARLGLKWSFSIKKNHAFHLGLLTKHNNIQNKSYKNLLRQGGQYSEILLTERRIKSYGISARFGLQRFFLAKRQLVFDSFIGFGFLFHQVDHTLPPDAEELPENRLFNFELRPGKTSAPDLLFGITIGYVIW